MKKIRIIIVLFILMPIGGFALSCQKNVPEDTQIIMVNGNTYDLVSIFGRPGRFGEKIKVDEKLGVLELSVLDKNNNVVLGPKKVKEQNDKK